MKLRWTQEVLAVRLKRSPHHLGNLSFPIPGSFFLFGETLAGRICWPTRGWRYSKNGFMAENTLRAWSAKFSASTCSSLSWWTSVNCLWRSRSIWGWSGAYPRGALLRFSPEISPKYLRNSGASITFLTASGPRRLKRGWPAGLRTQACARRPPGASRRA